MSRLAGEPTSFIRPSPSGCASGGITRHTREAVLLCEAAGFGVVMVETVGVGQGEQAVAGVADVVLLVLQPGAGDELQGMKRGILEVADVIAVNKADGSELSRAERAAGELRGAQALLSRATGDAPPPVLTTSATSGHGVSELWSAIGRRREEERLNGRLDRRRKAGLRDWLRAEIEAAFAARFRGSEQKQARFEELERLVEAGRLTPRRAAQRFFDSDVG